MPSQSHPGSQATFRRYVRRILTAAPWLTLRAYQKDIEARGTIDVPQDLASLGFKRLTVFDGWADFAESEALIVLAFRGT
jgi:hypothetical protein